MSKFKVGQKVKVREDLKGGSTYGGVYFNGGMEKYRGEEFEIVSLRQSGTSYKLKGKYDDLDLWIFSDDMLESTEVKEPAQVLHIGQTTKLEIYVERIIANDPATILFYRTPNFDRHTGEFLNWSETKKVVAKTNTDVGDEYDLGTGVDVATLKAFRKEIDKQLRKF